MECKVILVIDDDEATSDLLVNALSRRYKILNAPTGRKALALAEKGGIDVAIVSRRLPDLDGLEVVKTLKHTLPYLPVVVVAAAPSIDTVRFAFRSGAYDFISKPIDSEDLVAIINSALNSDKTNQEGPSQIPDASSPEKLPRRSTSGALVKFSPRNIDWALDERNRETGKIYLAVRNLIYLKTWFSQFSKVVKNLLAFIFRKGKSPPFSCRVPTPDFNHTPVTMTPQPSGNNGEMEEAPLSSPIEREPTESHLPHLEVHCFGQFRAALNGQMIENWPSRKAKTIFAYLLVNHKKRISRDILMDKFWPNYNTDSARNCLNVALYGIRRTLHRIDPSKEHILFKDECYFLNPEIEVDLDAEVFLRAWKSAQSIERQKGIEAAIPVYERAAAAYKGEFMEEEAYDSWASSERENLREIYLVILDRLSKNYSQNGKPEAAIQLCEIILEKDNCREEVHRRLMRCYFRLGQRDKALRQFRKCAEILKTELEVEPTPATIKLCDQIKQKDTDQDI